MFSQGAFRRVNAEVQACARAATAVLKRRLASGEGDTVESISLLRKFGEPVERLQVVERTRPSLITPLVLTSMRGI